MLDFRKCRRQSLATEVNQIQSSSLDVQVMPLFIRTPRNPFASAPYAAYLNVLDRKATAVQRALRRGGLAQYEPEFQAALFALCERKSPDLVFYDVGAHIGLYAALIEAMFQARCIAFEPTPNTSAMCDLMRRTNGLRFDIIRSGVSEADGDLKFFLSPKAETSNSLNAHFRPGSETITVPVTSLDAFTAAGASDPHIIKIDVETHEPQVLFGALKLIERARPIIACELLSQIDRHDLRRALTPLFKFGYVAYHVQSERPLKPIGVEKLLDSISSKASDWIFSPHPLDANFEHDLTRWESALAECGSDTNVLTQPGSVPPDTISLCWPASQKQGEQTT